MFGKADNYNPRTQKFPRKFLLERERGKSNTMEINKIYNECCLKTMQRMKENSIDLVVTSPPYDNLRNYNGYDFDFESIARELYRVVKIGGVVVWVVGDQVVNGSETGTSFKQALYFKEIGFNLHDTMIYWKNNFPFPESNRYAQNFEYMFVLSKGKPKTTNIGRVETCNSSRVKHKTSTSTYRTKKGHIKPMKGEIGKKERNRENIWIYNVGFRSSSNDKIAFQHPAIFPEALASDHIKSWSNINNIIYDPFAGSGTVAKMAILNNRKYIGSEISKEYCELAEKRIQDEKRQNRFNFTTI